ncbi:MAG: hypothetical protein ACOYMG_01355 [Candidatus Methylumidiphilus sp.]
MKICAVSPLESAGAKEILQFIHRRKDDLVVLPGNARNHPSYRRVARVLKLGVFAFVETGPGKGKSVPWLVSSTQQVRMPSQIFSNKPRAAELDELSWARDLPQYSITIHAQTQRIK